MLVFHISHSQRFTMILQGTLGRVAPPRSRGFAERTTLQVWTGRALLYKQDPESWIMISMTFPKWSLRSGAHLNLGLSPWPYGLNIKCIKALYLESFCHFQRAAPTLP